MCGFICVVRRNQKENAPYDIPESILHHRGPDYTSQVTYKNISLRHWRLSIVDLNERSNQPLVTDKLILAYNGEIYRFKEISRRVFGSETFSDTHLLADLLEEKNIDDFKIASGFYSYIFIDKQNGLVSGGRDVWGQKPLYYYFDENIAIFASEEKAIREIVPELISVSPESIFSYLVFKNFFFGNTAFEGIKELAPGASFSFDSFNWRLDVSQNWSEYYEKNLSLQLRGCQDFPGNHKEDAFNKHLIEAIRSSISARFECDVPVQLALSGGIDSSLLLAYACSNAKLRAKIKQAITISFDFGYNESEKASFLASSLGIPHVVETINQDIFFSQLIESVQATAAPMEHPHSISYRILAKRAGVDGKVLITGEGADELFMGYSHYSSRENKSFAFRRYINLDDYFTGSLPNQYKHAFDLIEPLRTKALANRVNSRDLEIKTHLLSLLRRNDKMSMANSVEIRAPFLDFNLYLLIEDMLQSEGLVLSKEILLDELIRLNSGYKSDSIKIGFYTPYDQWYNSMVQSEEVSALITMALEFIGDNYHLSELPDQHIDSRISWTLVNIGSFLKYV